MSFRPFTLLVLFCAAAHAQQQHNPAMPCFAALADDPKFVAIRNKVALGAGTAADAQRLAKIAERPTGDEKPVIRAWRAAREECHALEKPYFATRDNEIQAAALRHFGAQQALVGDLEAAKLTYGDFARKRWELYEKLSRDVEEIRKRILPPKAISPMPAVK